MLTDPVLLALIEGVMLVVAGFRLQTVIRTYRRIRPATNANAALHSGLNAVFWPQAAAVIVGEWLAFAVAFYALSMLSARSGAISFSMAPQRY